MTRRVVLLAMVLAGLPAVAAADPLRPPDGTYRYELRHNGTAAGTGTIILRSAGGTLTVVDDTAITFVGVSAHVNARYATADLSLTGYSAYVTLPSGPQHSDVVPSPGHMKLSVGTQQADIAADPSAPLEILADNFTGTTMLIPAMIVGAHANRATLAVTAGGLPIVATVVSDTVPARPSGILSRDKSLSLNAGPLQLVFWYDPATMIVDSVMVPAQDAEFRLIGS